MVGTLALLRATESAWSAIRDRHSGLPEADAAIAYVPQRGPCGHEVFVVARLRVRTELAIGFDTDAAGGSRVHLAINERATADPLAAMADLLHQAAHILARIRRLDDTGSAGRYHRRQFGLLAEELGLHTTAFSNRGWIRTTLPAATAELYRDNVNELRAASPMPLPPRPNGNYLVARCGCPRRIRVAPGIFRQAPIRCAGCGTDFRA